MLKRYEMVRKKSNLTNSRKGRRRGKKATPSPTLDKVTSKSKKTPIAGLLGNVRATFESQKAVGETLSEGTVHDRSKCVLNALEHIGGSGIVNVVGTMADFLLSPVSNQYLPHLLCELEKRDLAVSRWIAADKADDMFQVTAEK